MRTIYLDHQATTPASPGAMREMHRHLVEFTGNPHSNSHVSGWMAGEALERARAGVADGLNATADEIVFTSGATEANNIAIIGAADVPRPRARVVVSAVEHVAVLAPVRALAKRGFEVVVVPCGSNGIVDADAFCRQVDERTLMACLMMVNNEVGTVQPVDQVARRCREVGAMFHVDAAQALLWMPLDVSELGCTSVSVSAHKIGGPMGIGALWVDGAIRERLRPLQFGGEQEDGLRPGTTPGFLAAGFAQAVAERPAADEVARWRARTDRLWLQLQRLVPGLALNGASAPRHPGNLNVRLAIGSADVVIAALQPDVALSQGSACTSGMPEPSHVLRAMGLSSPDAGRSFRISTAPATTDAELESFAALFAHAVERAASISPS